MKPDTTTLARPVRVGMTLAGTPLALVVLTLGLAGCQGHSAHETDTHQAVSAQPHVTAASPVEAGRYIAIVGGCNDCHTDGYLQLQGDVPEESWLAGSAIGWRGPWGTTYASNLRLLVQDLSEDDWVLTLHERTDLAPMPWMNVNQMSESDARALYRYIVSLGPTGEPMPGALPPGTEPDTPYVSLEPQNMAPPPAAE